MTVSAGDAGQVLLVEDEASIADPFAQALARNGFQPTIARTASDALRLARAARSDSARSRSRRGGGDRGSDRAAAPLLYLPVGRGLQSRLREFQDGRESAEQGCRVNTRLQKGDTRSRILDIAERLVQVRGFNGFSYADVAAELRVTKASLHYHFPGKAELGEALVVRYGERFVVALAAIDTHIADPLAKLDAYASLYAEMLREQRMCLCGMLAAECETLAAPIRDAVIIFLDDNEVLLERVLEQGRKDGSLHFQRLGPGDG